jgi:hypothetical protein
LDVATWHFGSTPGTPEHQTEPRSLDCRFTLSLYVVRQEAVQVPELGRLQTFVCHVLFLGYLLCCLGGSHLSSPRGHLPAFGDCSFAPASSRALRKVVTPAGRLLVCVTGDWCGHLCVSEGHSEHTSVCPAVGTPFTSPRWLRRPATLVAKVSEPVSPSSVQYSTTGSFGHILLHLNPLGAPHHSQRVGVTPDKDVTVIESSSILGLCNDGKHTHPKKEGC